jgi:hypothetical protein
MVDKAQQTLISVATTGDHCSIKFMTALGDKKLNLGAINQRNRLTEESGYSSSNDPASSQLKFSSIQDHAGKQVGVSQSPTKQNNGSFSLLLETMKKPSTLK